MHATEYMIEQADDMLRFAAEESRAPNSVLTTGQSASVCKVTPRTVSKWFDAGELPGSWRDPITGDRRIPRASLADFLRFNDMAVGELALFCEAVSSCN